MPYKRNPMRCERMTALARALIVTALNPALTASEQWLERTLDDSANRRIAIPQAFLAADAILVLLTNVARGLTVNEAVVARTLERERPFLMSEPILMRAVELGGDRQDLHERIRVHAVAAATRLKEADGVNDLLERLAGDPAFAAVTRELDALAAGLIGRAPAQVDAFLEQEVRPALGDRSGWADLRADVKV
jgi:adenylosuccinate lyase